MIYEHHNDRRLNFITPEYIQMVAKHSGKTAEELYREIAIRPVQILKMFHNCGIKLNGEAHLNNFSLTEDGKVLFVSDTAGAEEISPDASILVKLINWIVMRLEVIELISRTGRWWNQFRIRVIATTILGVLQAYLIKNESGISGIFFIFLFGPAFLGTLEKIIKSPPERLSLKQILNNAGCKKKTIPGLIRQAKKAYYQKEAANSVEGKRTSRRLKISLSSLPSSL